MFEIVQYKSYSIQLRIACTLNFCPRHFRNKVHRLGTGHNSHVSLLSLHYFSNATAGFHSRILLFADGIPPRNV